MEVVGLTLPSPVRPPGRAGPVDWNSVTLTVLAAFGLASVIVTQLVQFLKQLPELFRSIREAWSSLRSGGSGGPDEPPSA